MKRATCNACHQRPVAVNYHRKNKTYYRNRCDSCVRHNKMPKDPIPSWVRSGYKKRDKCEKCGFRSRVPEQMNVWYIDTDVNNNQWSNLKTICSNCKIELVKKKIIWTDDELKADF